MNGLLGESWDDPRTQAVMSMAAGLLGGGNFGEALGRGLGGYQSVMKDAKASERQKIADDMAREQLAWKRDDRAREVAQQQQRQQAMGQLRQAMDSGQVTGQELLKLGIPMDLIKEAMSVKDMGRPEIARTIEIEGPGGQKLVQGFDKSGAPVGQGVAGYVAPVQVNQGNQISFVKPTAGQSLAMGMSPEARDASARGWASNNLARQRFEFDQRGGADAVNGGKPQFKDGNWVMPPRGMQPGQTIPAIAPVAQRDAVEAINLIEQARKVIPNATGSGFGAGVDAAGRFFGISTDGDIATGQLQALEGALISKMPKMSGPQSDKDVLLYKQMAGVVGDPTIPANRKMAALSQIEEIQRRYAGDAAPARSSSGVNFVFNPETGKLESR